MNYFNSECVIFSGHEQLRVRDTGNSTNVRLNPPPETRHMVQSIFYYKICFILHVLAKWIYIYPGENNMTVNRIMTAQS